MQPEEFWNEYVGPVSPREFLGADNPASVADLHAKVEQYVLHLPSLYGLTLRKTWKKTWTGFAHNRYQVADGIICYLESHAADWDAAPALPLAAPRTPAPTPPLEAPEAATPAVQEPVASAQLSVEPETLKLEDTTPAAVADDAVAPESETVQNSDVVAAETIAPEAIGETEHASGSETSL